MMSIETATPDSTTAQTRNQQCLNPAAPSELLPLCWCRLGKDALTKERPPWVSRKYGAAFRRLGKKIAVITYTNAAADEIAERVGQDSAFPNIDDPQLLLAAY
jgi:DNA helicase-2/ATP-dependent DNA helicase PcrA